jgi:hypothetical protein
MGFVDLIVPVGVDQKQMPHLRVRDEVLEYVERRGAQPLQIVKEQGERLFRPSLPEQRKRTMTQVPPEKLVPGNSLIARSSAGGRGASFRYSTNVTRRTSGATSPSFAPSGGWAPAGN